MASPVYRSGGRYWGKVISQNFGKSREKKTPQFALTFEILGEVDPVKPEGDLLQCPPGNRTVFWYLTDKTMEFVVPDLERLGFNKPSLRFLDTTVDGYFDFTGTEVELYCKHEPYNGDIKERWGLSNPRVGIEAEPLELAEVRKLDALFGKSLRQLAGKNAQAPADTVPTTQPDLEAANRTLAEESAQLQGADDIPF